MGANCRHWHTGHTPPAAPRQRDRGAHHELRDARAYLYEAMQDEAGDLVSFDHRHACSGKLCPTYGAGCVRRIAQDYRSQAAKVLALQSYIDEFGVVTSDGCTHWVESCSAPACAPTQ